MKVIKYILAVLFIVVFLGALIDTSYLTGIFALTLGLCFLPPISGYIKSRFNLWGKRGVRYITYIVLLILAGAFVEENEYMNEMVEKEKVSSQNQEVKSINNYSIKDSLNNVLKDYSLTVCKICTAVSEIEAKAIKEADKKYPNYGKEHMDYFEGLRIVRTNQYSNDKGISEEILNSAIAFAYECSETERNDRINELKEKKLTKRVKKEKIEECFGNACNLIQNKVKKAMHNPKSFEYVDCKYLGTNNNSFTVSYSYRGQNLLGAIVLEKVKATVDIEKCEILILK